MWCKDKGSTDVRCPKASNSLSETQYKKQRSFEDLISKQKNVGSRNCEVEGKSGRHEKVQS